MLYKVTKTSEGTNLEVKIMILDISDFQTMIVQLPN